MSALTDFIFSELFHECNNSESKFSIQQDNARFHCQRANEQQQDSVNNRNGEEDIHVVVQRQSLSCESRWCSTGSEFLCQKKCIMAPLRPTRTVDELFMRTSKKFCFVDDDVDKMTTEALNDQTLLPIFENLTLEGHPNEQQSATNIANRKNVPKL